MPRTKETKDNATKTERVVKRSKSDTESTVAAKASAKRPYTRKTVQLHIQFANQECEAKALADRAIAAWSKKNGRKKTDAKDIHLYVKPEENMLYYVINEIPGSLSLFS
ncbi:MAG: DUF6465 family protein [Ruminococcus sp.]|nr:DUF6465 family protein [Ruminococcus sp.]